jgi:hypothetical protein
LENRQLLPVVKTKSLVIGNQGPIRGGLKYVPAKKAGPVTHIQQPQQCRGEINLAGKAVNDFRVYLLRGINPERDMVALNWQGLFPGTSGLMVGKNNKDSVIKNFGINFQNSCFILNKSL